MNSEGVSFRGAKGVGAYGGVKGRACGGWCTNPTADHAGEDDEALHLKDEMTAL